MSDVIINFKSEEAEGIVAVGTYLFDAAKRLGIKVDCDCNNDEEESTFSCVMKVSKGKNLLSKPTKVEMEQLSSQARRSGERLACQAKIEKPGEVTIMSVKKKETEEEKKTEEEKNVEDFREEFKELPLEKKIANLVELEAIALNETFSFVMNSPYAAVGKVMDVLAEFGLKMEQDDKNAKRPDEHVEEEKSEDSDEKSSDDKKTSTTEKKKTASKTRASKKTTARKTTRKRTTRKTTAKKKDEKEKDEE